MEMQKESVSFVKKRFQQQQLETTFGLDLEGTVSNGPPQIASYYLQRFRIQNLQNYKHPLKS
ncbi:hypothetical protein PTKIN_Ptkin15bG0041000 [Pterospermum kingtungense]